MRELTFNDLDLVAGGSEWGDNVLKYGGVGATIGGFTFGLAGVAWGGIGGAVVGTVVTIID